MKFIGREYELDLLKGLTKKKTASLVVVKGRRRIGKSHLIREFAQGETFINFSGIAPNKETTAQSQRSVFGKQLQKHFGVPIKDDDWWDLLWFLATKVKKGRVIILFDEISWMGSKDPDFLGKLKEVWDQHFKQNAQLILILCGSVSIWIEENILSNTAFVGRVSLRLTVGELPLNKCNEFFGVRSKLSSYEKFKFLSVTGGIPRYLEEWHSNETSENNIKRLCFEKSGVLFSEFEDIFSDALSNENTVYLEIVTALVKGPLEREQVAKAINRPTGGNITNYLENLISAGFIVRDYSWSIDAAKISKISRFRLSDNYIRFYLKYILPNKLQIDRGAFDYASLDKLPGLSSIQGLQFENLILTNRNNICSKLKIYPESIQLDGPYFQTTTKKQKGCQVDYLIQTRTKVLYVCEVKFSRNPISSKVISEMELKLKSLVIPKGYSCLPVLIHVNGVDDSVLDSNYFFEVIDFSDCLK